jgi:hypothetical protein
MAARERKKKPQIQQIGIKVLHFASKNIFYANTSIHIHTYIDGSHFWRGVKNKRGWQSFGFFLPSLLLYCYARLCRLLDADVNIFMLAIVDMETT